MCINIANEQLQHFFNEYIFKWEQEECGQEGIAAETICFQSNWPVVNLFLGKTTGLLSLIDEESRFPRATDRSLATKMHKLHRKGQEDGSDSEMDPVYRAPPDNGAKFGVNHYAGYVSQWNQWMQDIDAWVTLDQLIYLHSYGIELVLVQLYRLANI